MTSFATPSDLAAYLQSSVDTASAQLALDLATAQIRSYCGWSISEVVDDVANVNGDGSSLLAVPSLYITAVTSIVSGGVSVAATDYTWTSYGLLTLVKSQTWDVSDPTLFVQDGGSGPLAWPNADRAVTVTYTHGYAAVPDEIRGVCLNIAARSYLNPPSATSEGVGAYTVRYDPLETTVLDAFRIMHV